MPMPFGLIAQVGTTLEWFGVSASHFQFSCIAADLLLPAAEKSGTRNCRDYAQRPAAALAQKL
jgi:hypothetical protein